MIRVEDNLYNANFPQQKLPLKKKDEQWQHDCVNYIIGEGNVVSGGMQKTRFSELQTYYDLYNSIFDEKDFKRITNPFKVSDGFPATPQDFNIIRPKVDLLIGEETKRPFNFRVVRTSQDATSDLMDQEKEMLIQYMMSAIVARMSPEEQQQFQQQLQNGEIMPPEEIGKYMRRDYKDVIENTAYHSLMYIREKCGIDNEFIKGWKDGLIAGQEVYYVGVQNGDPYMERVNPVYFSFDQSPDLEFIEDASWCCRKMRLPVAEVYDRYHDKLSEKDLDKLNEMLTGRPSNDLGEKDPVDNFNHIQMHIYDNPVFDQKTRHNINVWHCCWKSFKKIKYVTFQDENGDAQIEIVDEFYKPVGTEIGIDEDWIVEVWEGYRAGSDLYFGIQPVAYQHVSIDQPDSQKLPYCGAIYSNTNSKPRSLVSILKPLQYMYIVLWYRLELAIARDKGKVINMDITQIPKSMNITPDRWMHYLSSVGVNFINPYESQWGIPGREGGKCFAPGTKVLMYNGFVKNIEDIRIGDVVMGPDNTPRRVLELHSGIDNMYKITPSSGSDVQIVNSRHEIYYGYKNHHTGEVSFKTSTPEELLSKFEKTPSCRDKYFLYRSPGIKFKDTIVDFDPYMLGLWLGDGTSSKSCITTADKEVVEYLMNYANIHNMGIRTECIPGEKAVNIYLTITDKSQRGYRNKHVNYVIQNLKKLGVYKNKHIPNEYIYTSEQNRLEILAGLIDSDGWYDNKKRRFGFAQVGYRKQIALAFAFIARSLGMKVSVRKRKSTPNKLCKNVYGEYYVVSILSGCERIPTKIVRKQAVGDKHWQKDINRTMFKIEHCGVGKYYGFSTDGDHLFLLGDFTIVHNSATFNQITSLDLTMSNVIAEYIQLMDKIEQLAGTITGITEQRQGAISTSELVGNVERSVLQSSHITEPLFWVHNQCKKHVLTMLLNTAKGVWEESGKKKLQYVFDNGERAFLAITKEFYYEDMDVFVSDTSKDAENIAKLQQLIQPAMQNGASLLEAAEVLTNDNFNIIKQKLKDMQDRQDQLLQQQQEAQQQQAMQLQQMQNEAKEQELMLKEAEMDLQRYKIDADNQTKIAVAEISTYRGTENKDINMNGIPDPMEIAKDATQQRKIDSEAYTKRYEARQKKEIEDKKINLAKEQMKHETELQKQKDEAAMQREELKAKTALKNKVVGER